MRLDEFNDLHLQQHIEEVHNKKVNYENLFWDAKNHDTCADLIEDHF